MRNEPGDSAVWADIAGRDLRMARLALNDSPPMPAEACFHAQQAAEKFLKAFLVANRIPPPRTHDLIHLLALLEALAGPCDELNGLATDTRYPPEGEESPTAGHAQTAIRNAEAVAAQIRASIAAR